MRWEAFAVALLAVPSIAAAQEPDQRLAGPMLQAQSAQIALLQASIRANEEDLAAERLRTAPALNAFRWFAAPLARLQ